MNNLYFIETDNYKIIDLEVKKILEENNFQSSELIKYDLSSNTTLNLINEIDTYSIFQEKKAVLGFDAIFLTTMKSEIEQNIKVLEDYINNPNPSNILILSCVKLDGKKNICKLIKDKFIFRTIDIDYEKYIKNYLKNYKIDNETAKYILSLTGDNIIRIGNELDKLIGFKDNDSKIIKNDIDQVLIPKTDDNLFNLTNFIMKKNRKASLKLYTDLINNKIEPIVIIINLARQFRLMYQIKVLSNKSDNEIMNILNIKNSKQIKAIRYNISYFSEKELLNNLYELSLMDEKIKTSRIAPELVLPIFIANL